jgi:hypothetical protein
MLISDMVILTMDMDASASHHEIIGTGATMK